MTNSKKTKGYLKYVSGAAAGAAAATGKCTAAAWLRGSGSSSSGGGKEDDHETDDTNSTDDHDDDTATSRRFAKAEEEIENKNSWIHHMALDKDMVTEKPGNKIRAYQGLKGCEWMVDSAVLKGQGYVWAPMIKYATEVMGYQRTKNIDAAPYDWRLAPSVAETRDGYLTNTLTRIEKMYDDNDELPIILCCHSMGCKMGHYLLNFAKQEKGQDWLDKYIHTYMPVGAPHGGVALSIRTGAIGKGLATPVDTLVGNLGDGLTLYRSWSSGNWLMPRYLPPEVFPSVIVRREGELGLTLTSKEIEVTSLFQERERRPKELRLTIEFRSVVRAHSDFHPVVINDDTGTMTVSFQETFYLAVPYLGDDDNELGEVKFYLEEPAGRLNQNKTELGKKLQQATGFMRGLKKKASAFYRDIAKKYGTVLRVAQNEHLMVLNVSDFDGVGMAASTTGKYNIETTISLVGMIGGKNSQHVLVEESDSEDDENDNENDQENTKARSFALPSLYKEPEKRESIGSISLTMSYSRPPRASTEPTTTPIAVTNKDTPTPHIISKPNRLNTISSNRVKYDVWSGTDLFKNDGFVDNMFEMVEQYYEGDPIGPITKSALDAPPVQIIRSIYGINVPTEVSTVYRKVPVVTVGDNVADSRYMVDTSASFPPATQLLYNNDDPWSRKHLLSYKIHEGIITETPMTLQNIPGKEEKRRVCGDGTVPYWNMIHALTWKDDVKELTVDEVDGAVHREIIADERFFALLKRYCKVVDPRANAMLMMRSTNSEVSAGIGGLSTLSLNSEMHRASTVEDYAATADWGAYLRRYEDLQKVMGDDIEKAEQHYFEYGFQEKRDCQPGLAEKYAETANWHAYLERYPDLQQAFGKHNYKKARQHYLEYGFKEHRDCSLAGPDEATD